MPKQYSPYIEIEWPEERPDVDELILLHRLNRGEITAGVTLLTQRSGGRLTFDYVLKADLDSWAKWISGMRAGIAKANAPGAARQIEEQLARQVTLPENMRLRVEVVEGAEPPSQEMTESFTRLLDGIDFGGNNAS